MATIKSKIIINVVILLLTIIGIVGLNYSDLRKLRNMQDEGAKRAHDAVVAKEASMGGVLLYQIIADAIINRDLAETDKDWSAKKVVILKEIEAVIKASDTPEEKKLGEEVKASANELIQLFETKMLPLLKTSEGISADIKELDGKIDEQAAKIESGMDNIVVSMEKEMKTADAEFDSTITAAITKTLVIGVIGILMQAGLAGWLMTTIMRPVNALRDMLQDISQGEGDLTKRLDDTTQDELADVSRYFNLFIEKLRGMISQIASTTEQVASASVQLNATADQMATGAEEVSAQAATVATAGEEMSATSGDIAQNCQLAAEGSQQASSAAVSGSKVVDETITVMNSISDRDTNSAKAVASLGARSDQIGAIVGTIEDIADQTNLLALNAAIEAARAGEQGRGFAVVADEVRALAERTTKATREIGEMIKAIQQETKGAVIAMEEGVHEVAKGSEKAADSGRALEQILDQINNVTTQIHQVATAAEEQTATTSEISNNMHQITEVVAQTASGAQESAAAAHQLASLAEDLRSIVRQFKL
jgi:methyl-accepting chemotaxis protein